MSARKTGRAIIDKAKAVGRAIVNIPEDFQSAGSSGADRGLREGATNDRFNDLR